MTTPNASNVDRVLLWNVKQAAEALGLSVHTLYSWVSQHRIPYVKMGKRTMFDPMDVQAWIKRQKVEPNNAG